jgi:hypothetical protein
MRPLLRHVTLRRALLGLGVVALLIVVGSVRSRHDDLSPSRAKAELARVASPGSDWVAGGAGLGLGWDENTVDQDSLGVWTGVDRGPNPESGSTRYAVTWQLDVRPGDAPAACSQVAAWLVRTGPKLPGHPDGLVEDATVPSRPEILGRCQQVLENNPPGATFDETFAMWQPTSRYAGFEYHAYAAFHGDARHRALVVTALAQQIQS